MKQTIEIEVPDGKRAIWKDGKIVFEEIRIKLPKTWEEFCEIKNLEESEAYIDNSSECIKIGKNCDISRKPYLDQNVLPSIQAAEAHLALMQLHQLRDCYRQRWTPNWKDYDFTKYCIECINSNYTIIGYSNTSKFLSFQSREIAEEFLNNFKDLIEQTGDLI